MPDSLCQREPVFSLGSGKVFRFIAVSAVFLALFCGVHISRTTVIAHEAEARQQRLQSAAENVSDVMMSYTHVCDAIAASSNVRQCAGAEFTQTYTASSYAYLIRAELLQIISVTKIERSQVALFFLNSPIIVTPSQYYINSPLATFFSRWYKDGPTLEMVLERLDNTWNTFCIGDRSWLIRTIYADAKPAAFIILELDLRNLASVSENEIVLIGSDTECVYSNVPDVSNEVYFQVLESTKNDRDFPLHGKTYTASKNVFSTANLNILVGVPRQIVGAEFAVSVFWPVAIAALVFLTVVILRRFLVENYGSQADTDGATAASEPILCDPLSLGLIFQRILKVPEEKAEPLIQRCLTAAGIDSERDCFIIGFSYLEDSQGLFQPSDVQGKHEYVTPHFVLNNLLQDFLFNKRAGTLGSVDNYFIALAERFGQETVEDVGALCHQLTAFYQEHLGVSLAATQPILTCKSDLKKAIETTLNEITHRSFWRSEGKNAASRSDENSMVFFKLLGKMRLCFENEKFEEASGIFDEIIESHLPTNTKDISIAKNRIYTMFDMLVSVTGTQLDGFAMEIRNMDSIVDFRNASKQLLNDLIERQQINAVQTSSQARINSVKSYVHTYLTSNDLNVSTIAEHFGLNKAYLSRIFKESTGMNLLEYIQRTRVDAAKEMLCTRSVKETAAETGFGDMQSFVRAFKKYEGITPAEYKKLYFPHQQ